jgi:hypothetical protein
MRLPAVQLEDGAPVPWTTRLRRVNLVFGLMALVAGVATGVWWAVIVGVLGVGLALLWPSHAGLKAMREAEEHKALGDGEG